ncbi:AAA family ATPase [Herpetosiphon giganteus]|uniref:AAA family ATPase n=1 Tax=Herpetosiphon giganteus TaxID=2029754 RepID=UPI00195B533A|nr:AAA family ATPase [Herpetosiphon giganteus]MBM7845928.1 magnesium chelatase subunit I [Herpetosiphon giganteus]
METPVMSIPSPFHPAILPYSAIVGQNTLKLALELAYVEPGLLGVLISGHRGSGKSTAVRAFSMMMDGHVPVTIPINATTDRVIGGWNIPSLLQSQAQTEQGLLEEANKKLLYIDEVNLLDDHIVNIILDVTATGLLTIQREGRNEQSKKLNFTFVGTMNPEEGLLRPQLLDRFGLMVMPSTEDDIEIRVDILRTLLNFNAAVESYNRDHDITPWLQDILANDHTRRDILNRARIDATTIVLSDDDLRRCARIAQGFNLEGHRGDQMMALALKASKALQSHIDDPRDHLKQIAPLAIYHRRMESMHYGWTEEEEERLAELIYHD